MTARIPAGAIARATLARGATSRASLDPGTEA